jgi:SSS family solute:Na+ symporter
VNVLQLTVKLVGFIIALFYLLNAGGWLTALKGSVTPAVGPEQVDAYFGLAGKGWSAALNYLAILGPSFIVSPGILQKIFGARDERAVRIGVGANALGLLAYAVVPVLMGIIARSRYPSLSNHELALPTLLTGALPLWMGALLLGAIFSAELSASDAVLFMLSTSLSKDLYKTFINREATDDRLIRVARVSAIVCGAMGAILGILLPTVISALKIFYTLLSAALLLPIVFGLYTKGMSARTATLTMLASVVVTFAVEVISSGQGLLGMPSLVVGVAAGVGVMLISQPLTKQSG